MPRFYPFYLSVIIFIFNVFFSVAQKIQKTTRLDTLLEKLMYPQPRDKVSPSTLIT